MEALSKIQETERILQLLEDETSLLKETLGAKESDLSEFESLEARNKEALVLIHDLEAQVETLNQENVHLKEIVDERETVQEKLVLMENENEELRKKVRDQEDAISDLRGDEDKKLVLVENENAELKKKVRDQEDAISGLRRGKGKSGKGQIQQAVDRKDKNGKKFQDKLVLMENENVELKKKIRDQEDVISGLREEESKSVDGQIQQAVDQKIEEIGKEFQEKLIVHYKENVELKKKMRDQEDIISGLREEESKSVNGRIQEAVDRKVEEIKKGLQEKLVLVENENVELKKKVRDQERIISGLRGGEGKSVKGQIELVVDRKVEEMRKEFHEKIEANIKIMKQRIRIAEQLQAEYKESFKRIREQCVLEHFDLGERVQMYSKIIATSKREVRNLFGEANVALLGLESSVERFGAKEADFLDRISKIGDEIIVMRDRIKAKKEDEERLKLMRRMARLEFRVNELEKSSETKEEAIFELVEAKKEAIRQLSFCIEHHRNRCGELLKSLYSATKVDEVVE